MNRLLIIEVCEEYLMGNTDSEKDIFKRMEIYAVLMLIC